MARELNRGRLGATALPLRTRSAGLILSRQEVIGLLHTVMAAPITSTIRGAPSEVVVGVGEGLKHESAVNLDHIQTIERSRLEGYMGHLSLDKMREVCRVLAVAAGCDA